MNEKTEEKIKKQFEEEISEKARSYLHAILEENDDEKVFYDNIYEIAGLAKKVLEKEKVEGKEKEEENEDD